MKIPKFILGFTLCAVAVLCMAQSTVIRRLRDLADVRLPATPTTGHVLSFNGTAWTNAVDGGVTLTNTFNANQFTLIGGTNVHFSQYAAVTNLQAESGSYAAPAYGFGAATNSGLLRDASGYLNLSVAAARVMQLQPAETIFGTNTAGLNVTLNGSSNSVATIKWTVEGNKDRWQLQKTSGETGSDVGSDFSLFAFTDAGALIDNPLKVTRAAGGQFVSLRPTVIKSTLAVTNNFTAHSGTITNALTNGVFRSVQQTLAYAGETNVVVDCTLGNFFSLLVTNAAFITVTNIYTGWSGVVHLRQDATGTYAVTSHTNYVAYSAGTQPTITTNANARDVIYLVSGGEGTNVLAVAHANFLP